MCRCLQHNDVLSQRDDRLKRRGEQAVALAVFKIIASISVPILVVIYFAQGDRSMGSSIGSRRGWLVTTP